MDQLTDSLVSPYQSTHLQRKDITHNAIAITDSVADIFTAQAQRHPGKIALIDGTQEISFQTLLHRTEAIAAKLAESGIVPGALVGVCMERSWELVATLLGVLRAGCVYVPLDPAYPRARTDYMLAHSKAAAVIVDSTASAELCQRVSTHIVLADINDEPLSLSAPECDPQALAYVIYTSGSTGEPKGVAVTQSNVLAMCNAMGELLCEEELSGVLAATSVCFDPSVMEIIGTLLLGGTVILAKNILALPDLPHLSRVRTCIAVPSAIRAMLSGYTLPNTLRCVIFGGEVLNPALVKQVYNQQPGLRVINVYGPTEDTVFSTAVQLHPDMAEITIGQPVANTRAYVLDRDLQPVPEGAAGELYLAGDKLAAGYLFDIPRTDARFVTPAPDSDISESRLYKTGDMCQWTEQGELRFISRVDQQVKIRGFRVELEEIETVLNTMPGIAEAAVNVLQGENRQARLQACIVCQQGEVLSPDVILSFVARHLPNHMVPRSVRFIDALPYLPNGKLDRSRLPDISEDREPRESCNTGDSEQAVIEMICDELSTLLGHTADTVLSQTFEQAGLDSLTTLELSNRLGNILGVACSVQAIYEFNTPQRLAQHLLSVSAGESLTVYQSPLRDTLEELQFQLRASHPPFALAKAQSWSAADKSKLVQAATQMVSKRRANPYSKVLRTGSGTRGTVADARHSDAREAIIWTTNLYLGLNRDAAVIEAARQAVAEFGTGMGTSAAASGLTDLHLAFEQQFASLVGKPAACLFPTGYTANVGAVAGLLGENDVVVIDQLCHASIVDGARLCGAKVRTFKHNDVNDLASVLETEASPYRTVLVVIEGVYSMGEGAAPVAEIVRMAKYYQALVLVDEAHSFGFYGKQGAGICAEQGISKDVDFIMTTLSKSLGSLGGVVATSAEYVELLKASSRAYIFQASVSPADIAAALTALQRISQDDSLRKRLWDTARYMRAQFSAAGFDLGSGDGPIVTPHFGDKDKLYAIVQRLFEKGIQASAVTYPIVETGRGRLRFICSAAHTKDDVDATLAALQDAVQEVEVLFARAPVSEPKRSIEATALDNWWAEFLAYLQRWQKTQPGKVPDLRLEISTSASKHTLTLLQGTVSEDSKIRAQLPVCRIRLITPEAVAALICADVQQVLQGICDGECNLSGQSEVFSWFMGRLLAFCAKSEPVTAMSETVGISS
ncbi:MULTISPECIES: amino acid adenylation domain-containing protein [unclassified Pseudoalteromonas]|uniref:amino acid adenylation domain-containing protein n=1 Tax=unclassified Pseudoalteromonas TaxID=194690 RepID=UPI002097E5E1|nr:amino acid adenylation domain-containing protein [Pseudoalteromonas sp. XMcav2-N]MCO7188080.1 amino acid adenylation domain-containing protein [Pseudoalteromonas sp. XMcav2-N]